MSPKLIIFDCDGTLIDSQAIICAAMADAFGSAGLEPPTRDETLSIVGLSLPVAIGHLAPTGPIERMVAAYKDAFSALRSDPAMAEPLYPGIGDLLSDLSARPEATLAMATGKSRRGVDAVVAHHGWEGVFHSVHTADDGPSKPHPHMLLEALKAAGVDAGEAVMIGDTTFDMAMARAADVRAIGVAWGYHAPRDLMTAGADAVHGTAEQLRNDLSGWLER